MQFLPPLKKKIIVPTARGATGVVRGYCSLRRPLEGAERWLQKLHFSEGRPLASCQCLGQNNPPYTTLPCNEQKSLCLNARPHLRTFLFRLSSLNFEQKICCQFWQYFFSLTVRNFATNSQYLNECDFILIYIYRLSFSFHPTHTHWHWSDWTHISVLTT